MPVDAGDVIWRIGGDSKDLANELEKSKQLISTTSTAMIGLGAAITGALGGTVNYWSDAGSAIYDMSQRTGMGTVALSEFRYAAEQGGTSLDAVEAAVRKMQVGMEAGADAVAKASQKQQEAAASGKSLEQAMSAGEIEAKGFAEAAQKLGINLDALKGQTPENQLLTMMRALASVSSESERSALAVQMFGKSGTQLLGMLDNGAAGLDQMRARAHELGIVFTKEGAAAADQFGDTMNDLKYAAQGVMIQTGPLIAQMMTQYIPAILNTIKSIADWISRNEGLVKTVVAIVGPLGALSLALGTMMKLMSPLLVAFHSLTGLLGGTGAAAGLASGIVGGGGLAAFALSTVGVGIAIAGATTLILKWIAEIRNAHRAAAEATAAQKAGDAADLRTIEILREHGIAIDEVAMAQMTAAERTGYLTGLYNDNRAAVIGVTDAQYNYATATMSAMDVTGWLAMRLYDLAQAGKTAEYWMTASLGWANAWGVPIDQAIAGANAFAAGQAGGQALGGVIGLPGYRGGGTVGGDWQMAMVGERGPEVAAFPIGTRIMSYPDMKQAVADGAGGGGGRTLNIGTINIADRGTADYFVRQLSDMMEVRLSNRGLSTAIMQGA